MDERQKREEECLAKLHGFGLQWCRRLECRLLLVDRRPRIYDIKVNEVARDTEYIYSMTVLESASEW